MRRRYMIPKSNNEPTGPRYDSNYLTMESVDDQFYVSFSSDCEYQIDEQEWVSLPANTTTPVIDAGHYISFRKTFASGQSTSVGKFTFDKRCNLLGNCNSIIFGDNADTTWSLSRYDHVYEGMFKNCAVVSIYEEFLPIQTLASYCYRYMFQNCKYLINTPRLFASELPQYCYSYMFSGCTSLTFVYDLSIVTVNGYSCEYMFNGCSSLVNMPKIEATTLSNHCYRYMFQKCTSLNNVQTLPATTLQPYCYYGMFLGCTSLTEMPEMKATTLASSCCIQMFADCTKLSSISLPATTLAAYCYQQMFRNCKSLVHVSILPATTLSNYCYMSMFQGCTSLTNAPVLPAKTLTNNCYYMMFYGCSNLSYIKALFTNAPQTAYMNNWVASVASSGTFVKSSDATWNDIFGVSAIPTGWNVLTEGFEENYLTITAIEDNVTISFSNQSVSASLNAVDWEMYRGETITINNGQKVYWKGNLTTSGTSSNGIGRFNILGKCNLSGNCNSLLFGDNANGQTDISNVLYGFGSMFMDCTGIVEISNNFLPALTLSEGSYYQMFRGCTSLTKSPELPATTLAPNCYMSMFRNCTSLTKSPYLRVEELIYANCYSYMFYNCSSLNNIRVWFVTNPTGEYTSNWVYGVASNGEFYKNAVADWTTRGVNAIPSGWTIFNIINITDVNDGDVVIKPNQPGGGLS